MDKKDTKILAELVINSRIPINKLAQKVGVSKEVALYRVNRLVKEKIILGFYTLIDVEALGFSRFTCFFQLKGISNLKEKEFMQFLVNHEFVNALGPVLGRWNVVLDLFARDKAQLNKIITEITEYIRPHIELYTIITTTEQHGFPTKPLETNKGIELKKPTQKIKWDNIDLKILSLISANSRIEYVEISKKLKLTPNAIKYRIKNLEDSGIIKGYTTSINLRTLGYEMHNLQLKLVGNNTIKEQQLKGFLKLHKSVIYYYKYLGHENWDMDMGIIAKNSLELRDFILELREKFGDLVKMYDLYAVIEELKGNYVPEGVFEVM